ncbi:MAG: TlpA disulfide reductase family protein [Acidobacteriota bacterium]
MSDSTVPRPDDTTGFDDNPDQALENPALDPSLEPPVIEPSAARRAEPVAQPRKVTLQAQWIVLAVGALALGVLLWPKAEFQRAPTGEMKTAGGDEVELESVMAPVTLLHFWSTWCAPCKTETPAIQRLGQALTARDGFELVMVAVADDPNTVDEFIGDRAATYYDDHWRLAYKYNTRALPETHLIVDGILAESFVGAMDWDAPDVRARIDEAIDEVQSVGD